MIGSINKLKGGNMEEFTDGPNILGDHVDAIVERVPGSLTGETFPRFIRKARPDEIKTYCTKK